MYYENHELSTKTVLGFVNLLISDMNIQDFDAIPEAEKLEYLSLLYKADDTWAYESIGENANWQAIKFAIAMAIKDRNNDHDLGDVLRETLADYFDRIARAIFEAELSEYKCEVRSGASDAEIEGMMYDKQRI